MQRRTTFSREWQEAHRAYAGKNPAQIGLVGIDTVLSQQGCIVVAAHDETKGHEVAAPRGEARLEVVERVLLHTESRPRWNHRAARCLAQVRTPS